MEIKEILDLLGHDQPAGDDATKGLLADAVSSFSSHASSSASAIRKLQADDPPGFAKAAVNLLMTAEEISPGLQFIGGLVSAANLFIEPLLDDRVLDVNAATLLAAKVEAVERSLDVQLIDKLVAKAGGHMNAIPSAGALRALEIVDAISDCSRLASPLVRFLRHPSAKVRSKAALLLGRANRNLTRVKSLLASDDVRVRANAVESLWGHEGQDVTKLLWEATEDPSGRVVVNALLGLCHTGDREAYARVLKLAENADPALRSSAAWAMGEIGDPEFGELLAKLEQDSNSKVRSAAEKSRKKLRATKAVAEVPNT
jgi:HEAT repeat protein